VPSQSPAEGGEEGTEEHGAELLFFAVAGGEGLVTKVEAVDHAFDGVGCGRYCAYLPFPRPREDCGGFAGFDFPS